MTCARPMPGHSRLLPYSRLLALCLLALLLSCRSQAQLTVTVSPDPITVCVGNPQTWSATYSGSGCTGTPSYQWFVDNQYTNGTGQSFTYTFSSNGTHTVSCQVRLSSYQCTGTGISHVTVQSCPPGCTPTLNVTSTPNPACTGDTVQFHASATDSCPKGALTYAWTFGDGGTGSGQDPTHSYTQGGSYNVNCTATDGASYTASKTITQSVKYPGITLNSATASPTTACVGENVTFSASATENCGAGNISYVWSFDEAPTTMSGATVTHSFQGAGVHTGSVTASDGTNSASGGATVNVVAPAIQNLMAHGPSGTACSGQPATFTASASDTCPRATITYNWVFSDGGTAQGASVQHVFAQGGACSATVTATDGTASQQTSVNVTVMDPSLTVNSITPSNNTATTCDSITFTVQLTQSCISGGITYNWTIDGTAQSGGSSISYQFFQPGTHHVSVTVTGSGQSGSGSLDVPVSSCSNAKAYQPGHRPADGICVTCLAGMLLDIFTGNARYDIPDPVPTRGWPLLNDIAVNSQAVELGRPMGNAAFTYDIHLDNTQQVFSDNCQPHMMLVDGDGTRLDFGPASGPYSPQAGVFSNLAVVGQGYALTHAGPPGHLAEAGNFTYYFSGRQLAQIVDPAGNQQTLYYSGNNLDHVLDQGTGKVLQFQWSGGFISKVIQNGGMEQTSIGYNGGLVSSVAIQNSVGSTLTSTSFTYSGTLVNSITKDGDPNTTVTLTYTQWPSADCAHSVIWLANGSAAGGRTTGVTWGVTPPAGVAERIAVANAKGGVTLYDFDGAHDLIHVTTPTITGATGPTVYSFTYNTAHQALTATDGSSSYQMAYAANGELTQVIDGMQQPWSWILNAADLTQFSNPLAETERLAYDDPAQPHVPTSYTDASNQQWSATHNPTGQLLTLTPPANSPSGPLSILYDETAGSATLGYPLRVTDGNGDIATVDAYDSLGDPLMVSSYPVHGDTTTRNSVTFGWDAAQRPTFVQYADGRNFQWYYTGRNLDHILDESNAQYNFYYCGPCGALTGIVGPLNWSLGWSFDADGDLTAFTDARQKSTFYSYGQAGELTSITYPDNTTLSASYDDSGRLALATNGRGQQVSIGYDGDGRPVSVAGYQFHYNPDGSLHDAGGTNYTYTPTGQVASVVYDYRTVGLPTLQEIDYSYNPDGSRASMTWLSGGVQVARWVYNWDAGGRLIGVTNSWNESTGWSYDGEGKLKTQTNANNTSVFYQYNEARGWPTTILQKRGYNNFAAYSLTYDNGANTVGNLTGVSELDGSFAAFGYDALNRLTAEARTGTAPGSHGYGYDLAGNRTQVDSQTFTFDAANKLIGPFYDADGNVRDDVSDYSSFKWNSLSQLESINDDAQDVNADYFWYDAAGHMVVQVFATRFPRSQTLFSSRFFIYDGDQVIGTVDADPYNNPNGRIGSVYTWGAAGLVSEHTWQGSVWYHFGPQGETRQLTDGTGAVTSSFNYSAYGVPAGNPSLPLFGYGGQFGYMTVDTHWLPNAPPVGIILCGARWYSPGMARWLSRDPIGYAGGPNLYEYCKGNPVNFLDIDGSEPGKLRRFLNGLWDMYCGAMHGGMDCQVPDLGPFNCLVPLGAQRDLMEVVLPRPTSSLGRQSYTTAYWGSFIAAFFVPGGAEEEAGVQACKAAEDVVLGEAAANAAAKGGTYLLRNRETGEIMRSGRTKDLARRAIEHRRDPKLADFEFKIDKRTEDYAAQRGREQILYDMHPGAKHNLIRPISRSNRKLEYYLRAGRGL